jgi:hypothetical protein
MRTLLLLFLMATPAFAQSSTAVNGVAPGCGTVDTKFEVKPDKGQDASAQPAAGKALVYFIEDDTQFGSFPKPTTRAGVDGTWVGATHGNSFIYFSVDPGEHHLCANWQAAIIVTEGRQAAAAHFTAEAGGVYYFRVSNTWVRSVGDAAMDLEPLDSDEGQLLVRRYSLVNSHAKK